MAAAKLGFKQQTVVIVDGFSRSGRACATFFALRGANVVINELQIPGRQRPGTKNAVDEILQELRLAGGNAVATYESIAGSDKLIQQAISIFGGIHVLVQNGYSEEMIDGEDFNLMLATNIKGAYKSAKAVWPHFKKQAYGRIIIIQEGPELPRMSSSINDSAAKFALLGFVKTLAKEGAKYGIMANMIANLGPSYLTGTSNTIHFATNIAAVASLTVVLAHTSNRTESGSLFEVDRGVTKLRWERASGALLNPAKSLTPGAILQNWTTVNNFSSPDHPTGPAAVEELLTQALALEQNEHGEALDFRGKVVLITGAGAGLGWSYALAFAKLGALVVVNDLKDSDIVVQEIRKIGGSAVGSIASAEDGEAVVQAAIRAYGRIDIIVNNAGFVRDKAFINMTDDMWDAVVSVHMRGTYSIIKAAWPHFLRQGYGRVTNTTSTSGIYGNFGQANYAAAKLGVVGLTEAFAFEGADKNIYVNTIAPIASTGGLAGALTNPPGGASALLRPEYIAPLVLLLSSDKLPGLPTGGLFEVSGGWHARTRLQRDNVCGWSSQDPTCTPEKLLHTWTDGAAFRDGDMRSVQKNIHATGLPNDEYLQHIEMLKRTHAKGLEYSFDDRDVILYNLSVGAKRSDLPFIFEESNDFQVLPTFGIIPFFEPSIIYGQKDLVPNFDPKSMLHAEHYLEIHKYPIPTSGKLVTTSHLVEVIDKGYAAVTVTAYTTREAETQQIVFYNELSFFIRGSGRFGGQPRSSYRGVQSRINKPPSRSADVVVEEKTLPEQAALYRLTGDRMPMHIDPNFSKRAGFSEPILHGACFFGFAGRHIYQKFGHFRSIKVKFVGLVIPGQTLRTEMWKEGDRRVVFQMSVVETGKLCLAGGGAELLRPGSNL